MVGNEEFAEVKCGCSLKMSTSISKASRKALSKESGLEPHFAANFERSGKFVRQPRLVRHLLAS